MRIQDIIAHKRDGGALTDEEIRFFIAGYTAGTITDYQASALLMAIYLRGMDERETATLTAAMAESGEQLDLSALPEGALTIDKHSTGGVGDKCSLVVVPILAAAGTYVCKMSGRGLGHTGGTLDKLESIPSFRVGLSPQEMISQVASIGACLAGQTEMIAPADKKLYALRDATSTVGCLPLIVSSILSKKLAGGAKHLLFDVKVGNGALLKTPEEARQLAQALVSGAKANGRKAVAVLSDMNQPLGRTIGNALEISEAVEVLDPGSQITDAELPDNLRGATRRFRELCILLANEGLKLVGLPPNAEEVLSSGAAYEKFKQIVAAQGGDVEALGRLPHSNWSRFAMADATGGVIHTIDTTELGNVVVALGGGRMRKEDQIDHSVGLIVHRVIGEANQGKLASVFARQEAEGMAVGQRVREAFTVSTEPIEPQPLVHEVIYSD